MSFKPLYADQVLDGLKTCEIRTCFQELPSGSLVLIYASSPIKAFRGYIVVGETHHNVEYNVLQELIQRHECRIPRDNWLFVEKHYRGKENLLFFTIKSRRKFSNPVGLEKVKKIYPSFRPPISYVRVSRGFFEKILGLAGETTV